MAPLRIHLIFKTHLDVGFTNYASVVVKNYFDNYIPAALRLARQMREQGLKHRFVWTTGSWLIYEFLEQASPSQRKGMETAIENNDISWHALPFTTHTELMDEDLFRFGLSLSQKLDKRFGKHTIAAKFTDVPGHTRGIIPLLDEVGVQYLHIGINPGSTVPSVPPLFRWQDPSGKEITVMVESGYGSAFVIPGSSDALAFGHTIDNLGPQTMDQVTSVYEHLQAAYPGADIFASTLSDFAASLPLIKESLPIVTQEIGDTWIHGIGSDPIKVSQFRELLRLRHEWLQRDPGIASQLEFVNFLRGLLMVPEHTWGMDEKTFLADHDNYSAADFASVRSRENFQVFQASWAEKRAYIANAVGALENTSMAAEARSRLLSIQPERPHLDEWSPIEANGLKFSTPILSGAFDPLTGSLTSCIDTRYQSAWADPEHPLGLIRYQTFSAEDYERFFHQYIIPAEQKNGWSREDFTKPGLEKAHPVSCFWQPGVTGIFARQSQSSLEYLFQLAAEKGSDVQYGCPRLFFLHYTISLAEPIIHFDLQWFEKPACRLPEAIWLKFRPIVSPAANWQIEKLGQIISPLDVVENGNRHLHAVGQFVRCEEDRRSLQIIPLDSPLVTPGEPSLLNFTNQQPDLTAGIHFNLLNNLWGTNFPMWFEEPCRFRFSLRFQ